MGNLHQCLNPAWVGLVQVVAAVVCGTIVGVERRARHKPAGMRTVTLICLGSTVFTMSSILLAGGDGDPGRVAAQVVTGIGFLGAGAIIREGGTVIGLTTAATIWVVAAIGVLIGAGYVVPAVGLSLLVFGLLRCHGRLESADGDSSGPPGLP
ncbi:MAG: MgtC/SapB family protein [Planctomycetes bacterium]|nr:MgtC/SapB family protein [Planctomycetota bacterium]